MRQQIPTPPKTNEKTCLTPERNARAINNTSVKNKPVDVPPFQVFKQRHLSVGFLLPSLSSPSPSPSSIACDGANFAPLFHTGWSDERYATEVLDQSPSDGIICLSSGGFGLLLGQDLWSQHGILAGHSSSESSLQLCLQSQLTQVLRLFRAWFVPLLLKTLALQAIETFRQVTDLGGTRVTRRSSGGDSSVREGERRRDGVC